jgi:hypothetical protein
MINIFDIFFSTNKKKSKQFSKWFSGISNIVRLSNNIEELSTKLDDEIINTYSESSKDLYISLEDFFTIFNSDVDMSMSDIIKMFKHLSEISGAFSSFMEVTPIIEDEHIILCPSKDTCDKHKNTLGKKIKIVMVR